jgi:hypothetical protein
MVSTGFVWHLWRGRNWPALPDEERAFHAVLIELRTGPLPQPGDLPSGDLLDQRMHYTAVLNALRCGISAHELVRLLPGVAPDDLLKAYAELERRRALSSQAWQQIARDPTHSTLAEHGPAAAVLLPVPLRRIARDEVHRISAERLKAAVSRIEAQLLVHDVACVRLEAALARAAVPPAVAVAIGAQLHNPQNPTLWGAPYYLPPRVGALSPVRVADLLEERPR